MILAATLPFVLLGTTNQGSKRDPSAIAHSTLAYSHKTHLELGLKCSGCQDESRRGGRGFTMGFPKETFS